MDITMETSDFVSEPGYASELSNSLYQLQQSGHLIDTFIKTKSGGINAHKVVLFANGGPFLQEQISRTVSLDTTMCNIDLSHVPHEDVLALVIYLYTGKLKLSCIQSDSCLKLFQFLEINLEKLKGNSSAECIKEEGSFEHVDDGLESENNSKSGDISDKMDSSETIDSLIPSSEKSDSGDSDNEPFEMEISNMQEVEVAADSGDNVCQAEIIHEKTGKLIKLGNVKIKPPGVKSKKKTPSAKKRKKKMTPSTEETKKETVPSTEKRKKALVHSANKRTKTSQLIENKKKGTVLSVKKQKKGKLESSEKVKELQEGTICSECSLDVHECVCEFATDIDTVTCTRCQIRYTTKEDFVKHREEKHSLRCGMCDFKITRGSNLVSHMLEKHGISSRQLETGLVKQEETTDQQNDDESPVSTETTEIPDTMEMDTTNEKAPSRSEQKYRLYPHENLLNAYNAVKIEGVSVCKASLLYGVPEQILQDRVCGHIDIDCVTKKERSPVFSLEDIVEAMAELGYRYTREEVTDLATDYAVQLGKCTSDNPLTINWFRAYRNRWPKIIVCKPRTLECSRAKGASA
ncbi:hypothetical protein KUTeg_010167 [Tegillarca granosa]|uniref:BTB domain-containing protein n=1 Tax=Tegillarca granosa TaxID=220873 RepID=A0ABQ9F654_TEGGR|nr:hypothetical protein KUTeg_010042 [Tegillarca granosa]KAJ8312794.1 hypothetical protein KUTeg_010167 [Tegillarca granosa]